MIVRIFEVVKPIAEVFFYIVPASLAFHFVLGSKRRKLRDVIYLNCYIWGASVYIAVLFYIIRQLVPSSITGLLRLSGPMILVGVLAWLLSGGGY